MLVTVLLAALALQPVHASEVATPPIAFRECCATSALATGALPGEHCRALDLVAHCVPPLVIPADEVLA